MTITLDTIELSDDLEWTDEISWSPIAQSVEYGATGALFIQESVKLTGRPITLQGDTDMAWITRATLNALIAKRNQKGLVMTLTINGVDYSVMFRHGDTAIDVTPVRKGDFYNSTAWYRVNALRFMEVIVL